MLKNVLPYEFKALIYYDQPELVYALAEVSVLNININARSASSMICIPPIRKRDVLIHGELSHVGAFSEGMETYSIAATPNNVAFKIGATSVNQLQIYE